MPKVEDKRYVGKVPSLDVLSTSQVHTKQPAAAL